MYYQYEKHLHNKKLELKGNIRVFCRVRPILEEDMNMMVAQVANRMSVRPMGPAGLMGANGIKSKKRIEELKIVVPEKVSS
jgi:hypothetical protein